MSERHWMPMYWGDYKQDTSHLTRAEHGSYLMLIAFYWAHGTLPADDDAIRRIALCSKREWRKTKPVLSLLFETNWKHKRIDKEIAKSLEKSRVNSANAKRSHGDRTANAPVSHTQLQLQPQLHKKERVLVANATEFEEFWKSKPARKGANPKHSAKVSYERAVKRGADPKQINAAARKWASDTTEKNEFVPQAVTWLNQRRFEDYRPTPEDEAKAVVADDFMRAKGYHWDGEKWVTTQGVSDENHQNKVS